MPWQHKYIAPEVAFVVEQLDPITTTIRQVKVYHTYLDDDAGLPSAWFFTLDVRERPQYTFDIRDWPTCRDVDDAPEGIIKVAIAGGWVKFDPYGSPTYLTMVDGEPAPWPKREAS